MQQINHSQGQPMQTSSSQPLRHLLAVDDLSTESLQTLFTLADQYKDTPFQNTLKNKSICSVFFEPSTRTFCSFSLAAQRLGASVVTFTESVSSTSKGESLIDTIDTLTAMQFDALVIRHQNDTTADQLAEHCGDKIAIINAGTGICHHPSQAILDAYTIKQHKKKFRNLSIAIIGDIIHSRVANSFIRLCPLLEISDIRLVGPKQFLPSHSAPEVLITESIEEGLHDVDVIMTLRIQQERMQKTSIPNPETYFMEYGLTKDRLTYAKTSAIVMHPGPMNRNIEIASEVADGPQSVILDQVRNGVLIRQAIFAHILR